MTEETKHLRVKKGREKDTQKPRSRLVKQWPAYLAWSLGAAAVAVAATLLSETALGESLRGWQHYLVDFISFTAFYFLAQALFPAVLVRLKKLPSTMGVSLGAGSGAGYLVYWLVGLPWGLSDFIGMVLLEMIILGTMIGILIGLGWHISKGRALHFWPLFLVAIAGITTLYFFITAAEYRAATIWSQGLTALINYLPVTFAIWWRHRPTD